MAGLGTTVARLLRQQHTWQTGLSDALGTGTHSPLRGDGVLEEIEGPETNPGNLRHLRYVPRKVQARPPLVVVLHGCTQQAAPYADGAGWIELADRYGFCLLLPEQRRANNPNLCFNWFLPGDTTRGEGEAMSIRQMISRTSADCGIDPSRILVTGLSAGGAMASAMLATYPDVFAGGAIIAGLPYQSATDIPSAFKTMGEARKRPAAKWAGLVRSASSHAGPWPRVSIWQGGSDTTVDPANAVEITKQWTSVHGLSPAPDETEESPLYTRRIWKDGSGHPVVEEITINGLGHGTPLSTGNGADNFGAPAPFLIEAGISSSLRIANFWGITGEETLSVAPKPAVPNAAIAGSDRPRKADTERRSRALPSQPHLMNVKDIGAVINKALKSAGLIK